MSDKFVLLLEFSSGIIEPLPLSSDALTQDRIVIAIDELKEKVWLWLGATKSMIERRAAQRKARSLVSAGYQFGPYKIGRDVSKIEILEGDALDDPKVKDLYNQLLHTLTQKYKITDGVLGRISGEPSPIPATEETTTPPPAITAAPPPKSIPKSEPQILTPSSESETIASPPSKESEDLGAVRVGILISSILDHFPMCYISVMATDEGSRYTIEDPDGIICQIDVSHGSVHFLQRYDFRGKRNEVLTLLRNRLASTNL